jgi:hypothetical protein
MNGERSDEGWDKELLKQDWYQKRQRQLRSFGYRGRWEACPAGRFGDFWKTLKDTKTAAAEVRRLDRLRL